VTLGCVRSFKPDSCPSCGQEILDEEVDEYEEEDEGEWNFYCREK
jgi:rRNA maturation endonuclease Nob1